NDLSGCYVRAGFVQLERDDGNAPRVRIGLFPGELLIDEAPDGKIADHPAICEGMASGGTQKWVGLVGERGDARRTKDARYGDRGRHCLGHPDVRRLL